MLLNIAEANGRYSKLDHKHFLEVAMSSAVKAAAYLDLYTVAVGLDATEGQEMLGHVAAMAQGFYTDKD